MKDQNYKVRVLIELIDYEDSLGNTNVICGFDDIVRVRDVDSEVASAYEFLEEGKHVGAFRKPLIVDIDLPDVLGLAEYIKLRLENQINAKS